MLYHKPKSALSSSCVRRSQHKKAYLDMSSSASCGFPSGIVEYLVMSLRNAIAAVDGRSGLVLCRRGWEEGGGRWSGRGRFLAGHEAQKRRVRRMLGDRWCAIREQGGKLSKYTASAPDCGVRQRERAPYSVASGRRWYCGWEGGTGSFRYGRGHCDVEATISPVTSTEFVWGSDSQSQCRKAAPASVRTTARTNALKPLKA